MRGPKVDRLKEGTKQVDAMAEPVLSGKFQVTSALMHNLQDLMSKTQVALISVKYRSFILTKASLRPL